MSQSLRIFLLGASGTIGRATARELLLRGHDLVCFLRPGADVTGLDGATLRYGDLTDPKALAREGFRGERFDAVVSCLASRSGAPRDAWAIDHAAHLRVLDCAEVAQARVFVLLSAICVQKPRLAFQHAKLAFETALVSSGLTYSIVRPTAYFKSLSGQIDRVRDGKAFLVFGDGRRTACTPISTLDLARYLSDCLTNPALQNRVLPIGGPGPALTPLDQASLLADLTGQPLRLRRIPIPLVNTIVAMLSALARLSPRLADKAELARIAQYYATESMLVWDPNAKGYDAAATPATGSDTLAEYYADALADPARIERVDRSAF